MQAKTRLVKLRYQFTGTVFEQLLLMAMILNKTETILRDKIGGEGNMSRKYSKKSIFTVRSAIAVLLAIMLAINLNIGTTAYGKESSVLAEQENFAVEKNLADSEPEAKTNFESEFEHQNECSVSKETLSEFEALKEQEEKAADVIKNGTEDKTLTIGQTDILASVKIESETKGNESEANDESEVGDKKTALGIESSSFIEQVRKKSDALVEQSRSVIARSEGEAATDEQKAADASMLFTDFEAAQRAKVDMLKELQRAAAYVADYIASETKKEEYLLRIWQLEWRLMLAIEPNTIMAYVEETREGLALLYIESAKDLVDTEEAVQTAILSMPDPVIDVLDKGKVLDAEAMISDGIQLFSTENMSFFKELEEKLNRIQPDAKYQMPVFVSEDLSDDLILEGTGILRVASEDVLVRKEADGDSNTRHYGFVVQMTSGVPNIDAALLEQGRSALAAAEVSIELMLMDSPPSTGEGGGDDLGSGNADGNNEGGSGEPGGAGAGSGNGKNEGSTDSTDGSGGANTGSGDGNGSQDGGANTGGGDSNGSSGESEGSNGGGHGAGSKPDVSNNNEAAKNEDSYAGHETDASSSTPSNPKETTSNAEHGNSATNYVSSESSGELAAHVAAEVLNHATATGGITGGSAVFAQSAAKIIEDKKVPLALIGAYTSADSPFMATFALLVIALVVAAVVGMGQLSKKMLGKEQGESED
ncbi:MAG: hypothetical protein LBG97_02590 [Coriobacteriales bacterium]|jgi:hypothetical protein|nr:hypothetical protein [Coriobacteriales bacterium]